MAIFIGDSSAATIPREGRDGYIVRAPRAVRAELAKETPVAASDDITVTLDRSVALVLFDFLSRTADEEDGVPLNEALQHKAELPALWATLAALESVLTEPFANDYGATVKAARVAVVKRLGGAFPEAD
jgi:hypothetical protein